MSLPTHPSASQPISENSDDWKPGTGMITVHTVQTSQITPDPAYQMRSEGTNPETIEKYASIMKESDPEGWMQFPLIQVFAPGVLDGTDDQYKIISGFHRFAAIQENGYDEIKVELMYGDETEALVVALGQNADRSQPRTQADIQGMMEFCLTHPEISKWSNNQIARWCAVSPQTVNNHEQRLSTSNLEIENRPAKLKFLDKHGNVSLRTRKPPAPEPPPDPEVDKVMDGYKSIVGHVTGASDAVEREQLERDISDAYLSKIRPFVFDPDPLIYKQRRDALLEEYPVLAKYDNFQELGLEDLRALQQACEQIKDELSERRSDLVSELTDLHSDLIWDVFPINKTTGEEDAKWKAALAAEFPAYTLYSNLYDCGYYQMLELRETIKAIGEHLKANGVDSYLPASYFEKQQAKESPKATKRGELEDSAKSVRKDVEEKIIKVVDVPDLAYSKRDMAVSILRSNFNIAHPDDALSKDAVMVPTYNYDELSLDELNTLKSYWQKIRKALAVKPQPAWVEKGVNSFKCQLSTIKFSASRDYDAVGKAMNLVPDSPLTDKESEEIVKAAHAAAKQKADEIHQRHIEVEQRKEELLNTFSDEDIDDGLRSRGEMEESYKNAREAFEAHPLSKIMDIEEFMNQAEPFIEDDILEFPEYVHIADAEAYKELWTQVTEYLNQNSGWVEELLKTFSEEEEV